MALSVSTNEDESEGKVPEEIPKILQRCIKIDSPPTSMHFHPGMQTLLLVGNVAGNVELWHLSHQRRLFCNSFKAWKQHAMPTNFPQDSPISVTRVLWNPGGTIFGVAFSKNIVQLYCYEWRTNAMRRYSEINAHSGHVTDIAFPNLSAHGDLILVTCGHDTTVKVWNASKSVMLFTFIGHTAPVYSLTAHSKNDIEFIFSTSINGEIKAWVYDEIKPKVEYTSPGRSCVKMMYNSDGTRLFSCGTNNRGESYLVEWNDEEGYLTRQYLGLSYPLFVNYEISHITTSKNKFLVVGDDRLLKVWHMDNIETLGTIGARQTLLAKPFVCFNKSGALLAAFAEECMVKVFANDEGKQMLHSTPIPTNTNNIITAPSMELMQTSLMPKNNPGPLSNFGLSLPCPLQVTNSLCRLAYTHSGHEIVGLTTNGLHLVWTWPSSCDFFTNPTLNKRNEFPKLVHPKNGVDITMMNDVSNNGGQDELQRSFHCFSISKNDSFIVSASGGPVSLFSMITFERILTCTKPPQSATCIAYNPRDKDMYFIGLDDFTILIFNVSKCQRITSLIGHKSRITGLDFSGNLGLLISSTADGEIISWDSSNNWRLKERTKINYIDGWVPSNNSEMIVQLHSDERMFVIIHETQASIYDTTTLRRMAQYGATGNQHSQIISGTFGRNKQYVYIVTKDGSVMVLSVPNLVPQMKLNRSTYLYPRRSGGNVHPLVIATHPRKQGQFALALSNGYVVVVEIPKFDAYVDAPSTSQVGGFGNNIIHID